MRVHVPAGRWSLGLPELPGTTLPEIWIRRWTSQPDALVLIDGWEREGSFHGADLESRTADLAAQLVERGVQPGDRVLWCARATLDTVSALIAVLRAGAVLVPLSPAARDPEVAHVVEDAAPKVALCDHDRSFGSGVVALDIAALVAAAERSPTSGRDQPDRVARLRPDDDALVVYTSGTTGAPKGAVHSHASLLAGASSLIAAWEWEPADRLLLCLPLFHVHGLCAGLFGTLTAGASAVIFDRFDEEAVLDSAARCTMFFGVPTMYHRLTATGRVRDLAPLRLCVSGSAPLAADLWLRLASDGVEVLERYGMTETLLTLSNPLDGERRPGSVGVPLPEVEALVADPDAEGVGELLVRGPSVCRGYWSRPTPAAGEWFATGDLVSVSEDGYVTVCGRRTELIITGGHNVYPAEVEAVLARHPGIVEVAVVGVPSEEWGEIVVAFVVGDPDLASLEEHAAAELAPFKRPRQVRLVEALPRNALGKVLRTRLR